MVSKDVTSCKFLDGKQPDSTLQVLFAKGLVIEDQKQGSDSRFY